MRGVNPTTEQGTERVAGGKRTLGGSCEWREAMQAFLDKVRTSAAIAARRLAGWVRACGRGLALVLRRGAEVLLALIVLFEEWGWRPLASLLARLGRWRPWAMVESAIADLPPYAALGVFALPTALFFPLKLLAFYFIAKGQAMLATGVFMLAKVLGTALVARIFQLTQPALMRIAWFAWSYDLFVPWKDALFARIRETWAWRYGRVVKVRVKKAAAAAWERAKPGITAMVEDMRRRARAFFGQA